MSHRISVVAGIAAFSLLVAGGQALAQHSHDEGKQGSAGHESSEPGHSHEMARLHGGEVTMTPHHHFEVVFTDGQARVYVYDGKQEPVAAPKNVTATMTLMAKAGKSETMELHYMAPDPKAGRTQGYFYADHEMAGGEETKAMVKMTGLEKDPVEFRTAVKIGHLMSYVCPMKDSAAAEDPGKCPKCGMEMMPMKSGEHMGEATGADPGHEHGDTDGDHHH